MELKGSGFNEEVVRKAIGICTINGYNLQKRGYNGMETLELDVIDINQNRHIKVLQNAGGSIMQHDIPLGIIRSREERDNVIRELYEKHHLSQRFLARFFRLAQPTISVIINAQDKE